MICLDFSLSYLCCYLRKLNNDSIISLLKIAEAVVLKLVGDEPFVIQHVNHGCLGGIFWNQNIKNNYYLLKQWILTVYV